MFEMIFWLCTGLKQRMMKGFAILPHFWFEFLEFFAVVAAEKLIEVHHVDQWVWEPDYST